MSAQIDPVFDRAMLYVLPHEGGSFENDPHDPGGATKFGISLRLLRSLGHLDGLDLDINHDGDIDQDDIRNLTKDQAQAIIRSAFWDALGLMRITDPRIAAKLLDIAFNAGPHQGVVILQRALRCTGKLVAEDGDLGLKTLLAITNVRADLLMAALCSEVAGFYRALSAARPALAEYLNGWLNRAYSTPA